MKASIQKLVLIFNYKKNYFFPFLIISLLSTFFISCKESSSPSAPQKIILTDANIVKLQTAADKVISYAPGLVAYIAVEGEGDLCITRGVSNLATNEPMDADNYFRIASNTKSFTTEAILILSDEGKIDLNKSISYYLPELNIIGGDSITVRMLGNMTSGLSNYSADSTLQTNYYNSRGEIVYTPEQLIAAVNKHPLDFTPGSQYEYCNTNMILLGLLITKVTGESVSQVFTEKIFQPLGMINTYWPDSRYLPSPYTHGYSVKIGALTDVTNWNPAWAGAAGILISKFSDLKIWVKEISERKLLSAASKNERFQWVDENAASNPGVNFYGFGLMKFRDWIGHSGVIEGYNSQIYYNTLSKITIIVYTNTNDLSPAEGLFHLFADILAP